MELYGRTSALQIGVAGSAGITSSGLRIRFRIECSRTAAPNKAELTIYNLSRASRTLLLVPTVTVRFLAGYTAPSLLFAGNPIKGGIAIERQGPDTVTTVSAQDGGNALKNTRIELSFTTATKLSQVYAAVLAQLAIAPGVVQLANDIELSSGFAYVGPAGPLLNRLALMSEGDWWVSDETLYLIGNGLSAGTPAVTFSATARSLIGEPTVRADGRVEARGLLSPTLRPGGLFTIQSSKTNGTYVAEDVVFVGDTGGWETPYYTEAVGKPLAA